jgi:hypothetical protein
LRCNVLAAPRVAHQVLQRAAPHRHAAGEHGLQLPVAVVQRRHDGQRIAQRRVQFVRHAGHQPAQRGELLRLHQLALRRLQRLQRLGQLRIARGQFGGALGHRFLQVDVVLTQRLEG